MDKEKLKIVFMGTPYTACSFLEYLIKHEDVRLVCTAPDKPSGRNMKMQFSSVKQLALEYNCKVLQPENLKDEKFIKAIREEAPDCIVAIAYGYKIPSEILKIPCYGSINIHFSLLPKYRGAAPVVWALVEGEKETGVTGFLLNDTIDSGDILCKEKIDINEEDNQETLMERLIELGKKVLKKTLIEIKKDDRKIITQNEELVTSAPLIRKEYGQIDWTESNERIRNKMRGFYPWPGSYTFLEKDNTLKMIKLFEAECDDTADKTYLPGTVIEISQEKGLRVQCGTGTVWIKYLQISGGKKVSAYDFQLGRNIKTGDILQHQTVS